ncbi:hypothetical protein DAPPUDRAFT_109399 [Daphnia pulex]|uniref:Uncharacterized protein n=1 Tax=Daphnia pulex TaxID=6669 RepID=E9H2X8_DAPPU|nr:hypothetical protein DAPPUDRAFT_109399 [Daphnia pulex]|eukprot:EFX73864.1 hypothetical protein DAPPUDRAFT_109399 [Daphnia pulex]
MRTFEKIPIPKIKEGTNCHILFLYAEVAGRRRRSIALAVPPITIMAENYLSLIKTDYLNECCEEHKIIFGTLPRNIVNLYKEIFEIDYTIFILRQNQFAIHHSTPFGVFLLELILSVSDKREIIGSDSENRQFFDYLVSTDKDFLNMCFVCSKCTEIAATKRRRQLFEKIAESRRKRQEYIDQLKDKDSGQKLTTLNDSPFHSVVIFSTFGFVNGFFAISLLFHFM